MSAELAVGETGHCAWLLQELPGIEPLIVVDGPGQLTLSDAARLCEAIQTLTQTALTESASL